MNANTISILRTVVAHGRFAAAKWAGHPDEREYREAQYTALQRLYRDITDSPRGYGDFNLLCGVTFADGHILEADGTKCINIENLPAEQ